MTIHLKRQKAIIQRTEEGQYILKSPRPKGLVLSGGGAKGISYIGMIGALNERGYLEQLTHVSGASAGAMTASIVAVGMSPEEIAETVNNLDIKKLLDKGIFRAKGNSFRNLLDLIYFVQIKKYLQDLEKPIPKVQEKNFTQLSYKIGLYEQMLFKQGLKINTIGDALLLGQSTDGLLRLNSAFVDFPKFNAPVGKKIENPRITFGDLKVMRELLPEGKKLFIKNLSVAVTNQTKHALEYYSEDTTPQQTIAQIVQWSSAHPVLFVPGNNEQGEQMADGGILDNMPEIEGLNREEVLCVKALTGKEYQSRIEKAERSTREILSALEQMLDSVLNLALGGEWLKATASLLNREKIFHYLENMIYINTGEISTISTMPTKSQKQQAIQNGYEQTLALLDRHNKIFAHPLLAVLYIGLEQLEQTIFSVKDDPALFQAALHAQMIVQIQSQVIVEIHEGEFGNIKNYTSQIENILIHEARMNEEEKKKALALCYKQVNFLTEGKYLQYLAKISMEEKAMHQHGWATNALIFILQPIKWILSLLKTPALFAVSVSTEASLLDSENDTSNGFKP